MKPRPADTLVRPGAGDGAEGEAEGAGDVEAGQGAGAGFGGGPLGGEGEGRREDHRRQGAQGDEERIVAAAADPAEGGEGDGVAETAEREEREGPEAPRQAIRSELQEGEGEQEGRERAAACRRVGAVLGEQPERKDDDEEADGEALHGVEQPGQEQARAGRQGAGDLGEAGPVAPRGGLAQADRDRGERQEEHAGERERCAGAPVVRHQAADRRAEAHTENQRSSGETGEAGPARGVSGVSAIEEQRHGGRPAGDRSPSLQEAQGEEDRYGIDPEVGEVEQAARREARHDEGLAPPGAIGEGPPERREEQVGDHLDGEEERGVGDRAPELVDDQLLQARDDQRQVEHGDEETEAGERNAWGRGGRTARRRPRRWPRRWTARSGAGGGPGMGGHRGGHWRGAPGGRRREILPRGGRG